MALTSAPGSNAVDCTRIAMDQPPVTVGKRHFVALAHRLVELAEVFVARAHQVLLAQHLGAVARQQCPHVVDSGEITLNLYRVHANRLRDNGQKISP